MIAHRFNRCLATVGMVVGLAFAALDARAAQGLHVLQLNLCNSGWAGCYTGRAVAEAAHVIAAERPDVVTLNEICRSDVDTLARALGRGAAVSFQPAIDRRVGDPIQCRDGEPYGIGLLVRRADDGLGHGDTYPIQDPVGPEGRAWLCAPAARGFVACTTHLVSTSPLIALAQCRHFFTTVAAGFPGPVVVGGDFNLGNLTTCLPGSYEDGSDGGLQHVAVTGAPGQARRSIIDMAGTTDHPALSVTLPA
ncbi:Endonuclease/Exonuclease/phosphatase family protein [Asanoa hainanensis]|uniref:Endonuclease/Exonuclease/phosphatase family protein n=1 Tax=Asanoa hainanensis TaxID=560556 RepID=A0A239H1D9_9ACTN|nr:endonuclease/exonuclease/phosphatase family protein [Asanoa hainanensis]SNS74991.1 Endonuclease/Exonuclease/phosphatase family protein [Asanoa hainanensis]